MISQKMLIANRQLICDGLGDTSILTNIEFMISQVTLIAIIVYNVHNSQRI